MKQTEKKTDAQFQRVTCSAWIKIKGVRVCRRERERNHKRMKLDSNRRTLSHAATVNTTTASGEKWRKRSILVVSAK